jgi:hypothetical protein
VSMSVALPDRRIRHAEGQDQAGTRRFAKNTPTFHKIDPQSKEGSRAEPVHGGTPEHWWAAVGALKQQCSTPGMLCVASAKIRRLSLKRRGWEGSWACFPSFLFFFSIFRFRFLFLLYFFSFSLFFSCFFFISCFFLFIHFYFFCFSFSFLFFLLVFIFYIYLLFSVSFFLSFFFILLSFLFYFSYATFISLFFLFISFLLSISIFYIL